MKNCKTQIYNLEHECQQIMKAVDKLLMPNLDEINFMRVMTATAKTLDHSITGLQYLSKDLRTHHLTEASTLLSSVRRDFSNLSKTLWNEYIQPISTKAVELSKNTIEKVRIFLRQILETLKKDMKNIVSADKALHMENPHSKNFIRAQVIHKKYEGKKKDEKEVAE